MLFSATDAARPMRAADEALASIVRRRLDKLLAERVRHRSGFTARVRHMIVQQLARTTLTPQGVAGALAVSRRTLSRRLAEEGTSFRSLLDDVRREFACALLQDWTLRIREGGVLSSVLRPGGIQSIIPPLDRPDTAGLQRRLTQRRAPRFVFEERSDRLTRPGFVLARHARSA